VATAARSFAVSVSLRQVRRVGSRLSWGIADQAAFSLTNFLLNVFVARTLGAAQFGAFTLAYVTYGVANNVLRGLSIEPLLVRFSATSMKTWRRATSDSTGTALLVGLATGCCALAAGIVMRGTTGLAFFGLGLVLPGLMLQDSWRYAFFAAGQGHHALINDVLCIVVEIPLLFVPKATGHANVFWFLLAWGAGAAAGAVAGAFQARVAPSLTRSLSWLKVHRDLGPRFLVENVGTNAAGTLRTYAASSLLGLESVGYMQAANVLMGPLNILLSGISMITIPEAAALMRRAPKKALLYCAAVSTGQMLLGVLGTVALLLGLPLGFGHLMLGSIWEKAYPLVIPTALVVIASCAGSGAGTGLHAMGAAKRSLRVALITAVLSLSLAITGAALGSMLATLYLVATANLIGAVVYWVQFQRALHEVGTARAPSWGHPRTRGRHRKPTTAYSWRLLAEKNIADARATGTAVSRSATQGSYVREARQGMPHTARPGEEMG
jgi:O-antigen/teichoic acid export membrane protein